MKKGLIALALAAGTAQAEVVATCGASDGHGYYVPGGLTSHDSTGWVADKISNGTFQLIRSGDDWDIIFTDSTKRTLSAKADGGGVLAHATKHGHLVVQVVYPINVETYVFWLGLDTPIVTYSQAKFGSIIPKHSLMKANCRKGG